MRPVVIIIVHPFLCKDPYLHSVLEQIGVQYIFSESAVEPLDIPILHRPARLDKLYVYFFVGTPVPEFPADKLRPLSVRKRKGLPCSLMIRSNNPVTVVAGILWATSTAIACLL